MKIDNFFNQRILYPNNSAYIVEFLNKAPSDEVYTNSELGDLLKYTPSRLRQIYCEHSQALKAYAFLPNHVIGRLWGNPQAILALKRKMKRFDKGLA